MRSAWADPEGGGAVGPDHTPEKSQKYRVSLQYWSGSPEKPQSYQTGSRSAVGNVSGYRCVSDCRSRGREFYPGPVPYFRGD